MGLPPLRITKEMGFRSLEDGTAYAMCTSLHCQSCGHLFVDYRFNDLEMMNLYADYRGEEYTMLRNLYEPGYQDQNDALSRGNDYNALVEDFLSGLLPKSKLAILDWGGDTGKNTPYHLQAGLVHIFDPSNKPIELANATNIYSTKEFLDRYDLVVIANVLEHLPFPLDTLNELKQLMSKQTVLYVEVPHERIQAEADAFPPYALKHQKLHWHEHINLFSRYSLQSLLRQNGLSVLRSAVQNINCGATGVSFSSILQFACRLDCPN